MDKLNVDNGIDGQKLHLHPKRMADWLAAKDDWGKAQYVFPIYVEISPIGACIHRCTMCSVDYMLDRKDTPRLRYGVMESTLTDMAKHGVLSTQFAGCGEPLFYRDKDAKKDLADAILHADRAGIDSSIITNAVLLLGKFTERAFSAPGFKWILASVNGGDAETHARIHRCNPSHFERVMRNLEAAVRLRDLLQSGPQIFVQIVALPEAEGRDRGSLIMERYPSNIPTIVPLAKRVRDIGVDEFHVKPFKLHTVELVESRSRMYGNVSDDSLEDVLAEAESLQTDAFKVIVRRESMANVRADDRGYECCHSTPFHWAYVEADGEVWGCSAYVGRIDESGEFGDHRFRFGNVNDQPFSEIWRGERRRACWEYTRKPPADGGLDVRQCMKSCQMDAPNRFLWKLTHPGPTDNFVK